MVNNCKRKMEFSVYFGMGIILLVFLFTFFFSYINEPIGDDVLSYYDRATTFYLDDMESTLGNRITSISQVLVELRFIWENWSGRMTGYTLDLVGTLLPKYIKALTTAFIFISNIFLLLKIVYKNSVKVIQAPLMFTLVWILLYWSRAECYYAYMWTMVSVYSLPVMLGLLYLAHYVNYKKIQRRGLKFLRQLLGFALGLSHEVLALNIILVVLGEWIVDAKKGKCKIKDINIHTGLGLGYVLCILAPGNFHRTKQSHDVITESYSARLKHSWEQHIAMFTKTELSRTIFLILCIGALLSIIVLIVKKEKQKLLNIFKVNIGFIISIVSSVFIWAIVPRCPSYGLELWMLFVIAVLLRAWKYFPIKMNLKACSFGCIIVVLLFVTLNRKEVSSYLNVSRQRQDLIEQAKEENKKVVYVPKFDETLSSERYSLTSLNDEEEYKREYYKDFYGIEVRIED